MAPSVILEENKNQSNDNTTTTKKGPVILGNVDYASLKKLTDIDQENFKKDPEKYYKYAEFLPYFPDLKWDPLGPIEVKDVALQAKDTDGSYPNLFPLASKIVHLTHKVGTVIYGLDLKDILDNAEAKNELALLISRRVAVFFKKQTAFTAEDQLALGEYFGPLHKHATTAVPRKAKTDPKYEYVHVVYADKDRIPNANNAFSHEFLWHSDVSYELQPPSYTSLKLLTAPQTGGDTLWVSGYDIYDQLSPSLQKYLEEHTALHSAVEQANDSRRVGTAVRREPVISEHPLVRVHPVTKWKSVYVNPGFTRSIVGVPKGESDAILGYLFKLISTSQAGTVRFKWEQDDIAFWDNRVSVHSATYGFYPERRHGIRVTTHGEAPYFDEKEGRSQLEEIYDTLGISKQVDGSKGGNYND